LQTGKGLVGADLLELARSLRDMTFSFVGEKTFGKEEAVGRTKSPWSWKTEGGTEVLLLRMSFWQRLEKEKGRILTKKKLNTWGWKGEKKKGNRATLSS